MGTIPKVQSGVLFSVDKTSAVVVWERSCQGNGVDGRLEVVFMGMGACDCAYCSSGPRVSPMGLYREYKFILPTADSNAVR